MDAKTAYVILTIVGSFCALGLAINAYFVKGMLDSLNQVKLQTAVLIEKSKGVAENKEEIKELRSKIHNMSNLIHQMKSYEMFKDVEVD